MNAPRRRSGEKRSVLVRLHFSESGSVADRILAQTMMRCDGITTSGMTF